MPLKVRSFIRHVEREQNLPALTFEGRLGPDTFVLKVAGLTVEVPISDIGHDDEGPFAHIDHVTHQTGDLTLTIELEPDEFGNHGTAFTLRDDTGRAFSAYLDSAGQLDGSSSALGYEAERVVN